MRVLITGIAGFCGLHLTEYLLSKVKDDKEIDLYGIDIQENVNREGHSLLENLKFFTCDILDDEKLRKTIRQIEPDRIFHLAGLTSDFNSSASVKKFYATNVFGTINLLEAAGELKNGPLVHIACSSAEYGLITESENPITEDNAFHPLSPYAISKLAQDMVGYQYYKNYGLRVIRTRTFNVTGPGEKENFVCSNFARQIALIENGAQKPAIYVGNLEAKRDFVDVRDAVRAYWLVLDKGVSGEVYNVCSGKAHSIGEILDILLGMTGEDIVVKQETERMRPLDIPLQVGSFEKLRKQTGWKPAIPIEKTLEDLLNYWRKEI